MPYRPAIVTQADITRAIRALLAAGLPVTRVVLRADGVSVETTEGQYPVESILVPSAKPERTPIDL
jgi:hypothetical protein